MNKMEKVMCGISCLGVLWFLLSWADVIAHNMTDQSYAWWNLITMIF
jgi:hypothetical protein